MGKFWISFENNLKPALISVLLRFSLGVDEPCANEPGWESKIGTTSSTAYSRNVRRMTADVASEFKWTLPLFPYN